MGDTDLFFLPSSSARSSFCPISRVDEHVISLQEYLLAVEVCLRALRAATPSLIKLPISQGLKGVYCGTTDRPPTYTAPQDSSMPGDEANSVLTLSHVLSCWYVRTQIRSLICTALTRT